MDTTARLALPLIAPGQAQKEMTHNEALALIDVAVQASVESVGLIEPPTVPAIGAAWIVGPAATGAWAGQAGAIAGWTTGGWRFVPPCDGMTAWSRADAAVARFHAGLWEIGTVRARRLVIDGTSMLRASLPAIADPAGGTTVDERARDTLALVLTALREHGLIAA